ncbi:MAG: GNAT family N-acetyltransferase [Phycisphaeraceae bacterium]
MAEDIQIEIKSFDELTLLELHACLKLRGEVFVVGQQICSVPDVDELDPEAHHVMMWQGNELLGTARLLSLGDENYVKVGRVAVAQAHRGRGHGSSMMRAIHAWIRRVPGRRGDMSAQADVQRWYEHLGWLAEGDYYMEAGIKHIEMFLPADSSA